MPDHLLPSETSLTIRTWYVRQRHALLARADFSPLYVDYYLHLADQGLRFPPQPDQLLKDLLACLALHAASRPWNHTFAWTLHFQDPLLNLFATADNELGSITGTAFTENIKNLPENIFYADWIPGHAEPRRSVTAFTGADVLAAVEHFYRQSEQRPARLFRLDEEEFALLAAQPDCDLHWLEKVRAEDITSLEGTEELRLLETRTCRWFCGCGQDRMCALLAPAMQADPESLFGHEASLVISCPRCGTRHTITRETLEAWIANHPAT